MRTIAHRLASWRVWLVAVAAGPRHRRVERRPRRPARVVVVLDPGGVPGAKHAPPLRGSSRRASPQTGSRAGSWRRRFRENLADLLGLLARQGYEAVIMWPVWRPAPSLRAVVARFPRSAVRRDGRVAHRRSKAGRGTSRASSSGRARRRSSPAGSPGSSSSVVPAGTSSASSAGWQIPAGPDFVVGFAAGARRAAPGVEVLVDYSDDFLDPSKCAALARRQIARGAGTSSTSRANAASGRWTPRPTAAASGRVGVDSDQSFLGLHVLTSVLKRFDAGFLAILRQVKAGRVATGRDTVLGLRDGAVGLGKVSSRSAVARREARRPPAGDHRRRHQGAERLPERPRMRALALAAMLLAASRSSARPPPPADAPAADVVFVSGSHARRTTPGPAFVRALRLTACAACLRQGLPEDPSQASRSSRGRSRPRVRGLVVVRRRRTVARRFPKTTFVLIDMRPKQSDSRLPNLVSATIRPNEASFLAGWLREFEERRPGPDSRRRGRHQDPTVTISSSVPRRARRASPGIEVLVDYSDDFLDPIKCAALARRQIARGAGVRLQRRRIVRARNAAGRERRRRLGRRRRQSTSRSSGRTSSRASSSGIDGALRRFLRGLQVRAATGRRTTALGLGDARRARQRISPKVPRPLVAQVRRAPPPDRRGGDSQCPASPR